MTANESGDWKFEEDPQPAVDGGDELPTVEVATENVDVLQAGRAHGIS